MKNPRPENMYQTDLIGFIDRRGKEILPPRYAGVYGVELAGDRVTADQMFYLRSVSKPDGSGGVVDLSTGKWIITSQYYKRMFFYDRRHFVVGGNVFYAGGRKLELPVGISIEDVYFSSHFIKIKNEAGACGLYNWDGKEIVPLDYLDFEVDTVARRIVASKLKDGTSMATLQALLRLGKEESNNIIIDLYDFQGKKIANYSSQYQGMISDDSTGSYQVGEQNFYFRLSDGKILQERSLVLDTVFGKYVLYQQNDQVGLRTAAGKVIIPAKFRSIDAIDPSHIIAGTGDLGHIVYNLKGERSFGPAYSEIMYIPELERFMVTMGDKAGQVDRDGDVVIPLLYGGFSSLSLTQLPPYAVYKDGKHGIIDGKGKVVVPFIYGDITDTRILDSTDQAFFILAKDGHYGMMDAEGQWILRPEYGYISIVKSDVAKKWVRLEAYPRSRNLYGVYNVETGKQIPPKYSTIVPYDRFVIVGNRVDNDYHYQLYNDGGVPLTDSGYTEMNYANGYLLCEKGGKYGILSTTGEPLVPFAYQRIIPETSTLIWVEQGNASFYMTIGGKQYRAPALRLK